MSRTYELVCRDLGVSLWVGQSGGTHGMGNFYSGEPKTMEKLGRFLEYTRGHSLVLMDSERITAMSEEIHDFEPEED